MWILNQSEDTLINLATGLRIAILPANTKEGETPLYGVVVQAPAEATLPLGRPLPSGFSNTVLMHGAPLADCRNLLATFCRKLEAFEVGPLPILPPVSEWGEENVVYVVVIRRKDGTGPTWVLDDEESSYICLHQYVENNWRGAFGPHQEIPADRTRAIDMYFDESEIGESYRIAVAPFRTRKDLRREK